MKVIIIVTVIVIILYILYENNRNILRNYSNNNIQNSVRNKVRTDGIYTGSYDGVDYRGVAVKIPCIFIFNDYGLVAIYRGEMAEPFFKSSKTEIKNLINEMNRVERCQISEETSYYNINDGKISITFYDSEKFKHTDNVDNYVKWTGIINEDGLALTVYKKDFNPIEKDFIEEMLYENLFFRFEKYQ